MSCISQRNRTAYKNVTKAIIDVQGQFFSGARELKADKLSDNTRRLISMNQQ